MKRSTVKLAWLSLVLLACLTVRADAPRAAYGDIIFDRGGDPAAATGPGGVRPAVFPHWVHRLQYRCYVCHPKLFEMKAGANEITMEMLKRGESCATCHNGAIAFGIEFQTCARCHVAPQE